MPVAVLLAAVLAGCAADEPQAPPQLELSISWTPEQPVAGEVVAFDVRILSPVAGDSIERVVWRIGEDIVEEHRPERVFLGAGVVPLTVQVRTPGTGLNQAESQVTIGPAPGQPASDPEPGPSEPEPGNEPEPAPPSRPANETEPRPPPASEPPATAQPPDWGSPEGKGIRPGINMVTNGNGCTTSFLVQSEWTRLFMATAAHCVEPGDSTDTNGCTAPTGGVGGTSTLRKDGGGELSVKVVYTSWEEMQSRTSVAASACDGNDFALLEIPPEAWSDAHPASLHFRAPTGLASSPTSDIWGFGASSTKLGIDQLHPKQGQHLFVQNDGWSHLVYLATPGIPGDSGGHIMTDDGQALGVASTVILTPYPAANHYTDFGKAMDYASDAMGIPLELVTWDDFNASLV